jgi:hypothetical protein
MKLELAARSAPANTVKTRIENTIDWVINDYLGSVKFDRKPGKTCHIVNGHALGLDVRLVWITDHYVGYFGGKDEAVVSLYTAWEAEKFIKAYLAIDELRAGRRVD